MHGNSDRCGALIHPSALIGKEVILGQGCEVGPFCRIEGRVQIGANCRIGTGVVIGTPPADKKYQGEGSGVLIGNNNIFFEFVTVHRATGHNEMTVIGDGNYIMAYVHIGHNCRIGNSVTLTNGVQLAGHTEVEDGANLGGLVGVHQFCRIGTLAMIGAHSYVNKDIPPFSLAAGNPCRVYGLNIVGLERAGFSSEKILALKDAFRILYRSGLPLIQALKRIEQDLAGGPGREEINRLLEFCTNSRRGIELRTEV
ncbi:MAG: acyl-ACP--UDP-N-acetylglucosamine O-acyltransferase [candidate division WOR-3 bacterium]